MISADISRLDECALRFGRRIEPGVFHSIPLPPRLRGDPLEHQWLGADVMLISSHINCYPSEEIGSRPGALSLGVALGYSGNSGTVATDS